MNTLTIPRVDHILSILHAEAEIVDRDHPVVDIAQIGATDKNFGQAKPFFFCRRTNKISEKL